MRLQLITLVSVFLLASAAPTDRGLDLRSSQSLDAVEKRTSVTSDSVKTTIGEFAGAVWQQTTPTFWSVSATFQIPPMTGADGSGAGFWAGLDGSPGSPQCGAMFSAGVSCKMSQGSSVCTGKEIVNPLAQWSPGETKQFTNIEVHTGDNITVSVSVTSDQKSGYATMINQKYETSPDSEVMQVLEFTESSPLCQLSAEWYVTNVGNGDLPNFYFLPFVDPQATGPNYQTFTAGGTALYDIYEHGKPATTVQVLHGGEMLVVWYHSPDDL